MRAAPADELLRIVGHLEVDLGVLEAVLRTGAYQQPEARVQAPVRREGPGAVEELVQPGAGSRHLVRGRVRRSPPHR